MAKASHQNGPDGKGRKLGANRIRYPGSPSRKRYSLGVGNGATVVGAVGKPEASHLGSTAARLKLKGIGGGAPQRVELAV